MRMPFYSPGNAAQLCQFGADRDEFQSGLVLLSNGEASEQSDRGLAQPKMVHNSDACPFIPPVKQHNYANLEQIGMNPGQDV